MHIASVSYIHREFINIVKEDKFSIEKTISVTSTILAKHLKLDRKGEIRAGKDADIIVLDKDAFKIKHVIARGKALMENEEVVKFGTFDKK